MQQVFKNEATSFFLQRSELSFWSNLQVKYVYLSNLTCSFGNRLNIIRIYNCFNQSAIIVGVSCSILFLINMDTYYLTSNFYLIS